MDVQKTQSFLVREKESLLLTAITIANIIIFVLILELQVIWDIVKKARWHLCKN